MMKHKLKIEKHMATQEAVPGVPGTEEVPGVPGTKDTDSPEYCKGYKQGYTDGSMKMDDTDDDDDADDKKDDDMKSKMMGFFKKMVTLSPTNSPLFSAVQLSNNDRVGVITIDGELGKRLSFDQKMNGMVDVDDIAIAIRQASKSGFKAAIFHLNSPGGVSTGIEETGELIKKLSAKMPVFAFTDTICASAAYWLASCCNGLYVTPSSEVGSIGVYARVMDMSGAMEKAGVKPEIFQGGSMKSMGHGEKPLTEQESQYIQAEVDEQYLKFKQLVSENRGGVDDAVMQGQLFTGENAVEVNLADAVIPDLDALFLQFS